MKNTLLLVLFIVSFHVVVAQVNTNTEKLQQLSIDYYQKSYDQRIAVEEFAKINNIPIRVETGSTLIQLMYIDEFGMPQYYITHNENAAKTISTNEVYSGGAAGLSLTGSGVVVHEWDGGTVLSTHQEFDTRVTNGDATSTHYHATHVAGTIMASGVLPAAKGMAFSASLKAFDWTDDEAEMAAEAADGALVSNHSYGSVRGWRWDGSTWSWYGNPAISSDEDYLFGFYDSQSQDWDEIAYNAPNYLIVKSAGNDRGEGPTGAPYPQDGPYDCIGQKGSAKNVLTVGAVEDIVGGWTQPSDVVMSSFSSWGPADDGRIKPDIVANGVGLTSTYNTSNSSYATMSGTSMSSPSVTGSVALLIQHYENVVGSSCIMKAATVKALIIHTADEAGANAGPDYSYGWGLMNTQSAAAKITEDQITDVMLEHYISDGETYTRNITTTGTSPIKVTIVWTDPAGTPPSASLDPADVMLVNDLDLRITQASNTYYPWKLDKDIPTDAATQSTENNVDNVEQVYIASPANATTYTITVDHDGTLSGGGQSFSLIISGDIDNAVAPEAEFYSDNMSPAVNTTVVFYDASANIPTSWSWSFSPSTVTYKNGTLYSSQSPEVEFDAAGIYEVTLVATNANGTDTETKTDYIVVGASPSGYAEAYSTGYYGYISRVQMGTIDKTSAYTNVGGADPDDKYYEDWTAESTDAIPGQSYNITVTSPYADGNLDLGIWVDSNRDGDFDDSGEQLLCDIDGGGEGTFSITIPEDADVGSTRMRLRIKYHLTTCAPTGGMPNGEVEDYTLNIQPASTTWNGSNTNWNDPSNWPNSVIPNPSYEVTIPTTPANGNFPTIPTGTNAKCYSITVETGATIIINGDLEVEN